MDMTNAALWDELQRNPATQGYTTSRFLTITPAANGIDHGLVIKNGDQGSMPMHTRHTLVHSNNQYQLWHYDTDGSSVYDEVYDADQAVDIMMDSSRVRSTLMPAARATSMSWPTARISWPSLVRRNQTMNRQNSPTRIKVSTGIFTPWIRMASRSSRH